jgi:hypothetical protein
MKGILADTNIQGHVEILVSIWESDLWSDIWRSLHLKLHTFEELSLARDTPDTVLWQTCQEREIVFITANRNEDGPDSLTAAIRQGNVPASLPVITLANPKRIQKDRAYAHTVAVRTLERLMDIETLRGTGRLFVP